MDDAERKEFGLEIRAMRRGKDWTQQQLADVAHVSVRTVRNLEAGRVEMQPGNLSAVLDALGYKRIPKPWDDDVEAALMMWGFRLSRLDSATRRKRMLGISDYLINTNDD